VNNGLFSGTDYANNYLIGVGFTWYIDDIYTSGLQKKRIEQEKIQVQYDYQTEFLNLHSRLQSIRLSIAQYYSQVTNTCLAVREARQAYDLYLTRYETGLISLIELLQLESVLDQAEKKNIDASNDLWGQMIGIDEVTTDFTDLSGLF
jgi:outer membrane protein TolC